MLSDEITKIKRAIKVALKLTTLSLLVIFLFVVYGVFWNYRELHNAMDIVMQQKSGIREYEVKNTEILDLFIDPAAEYWLLANDGFDTQKFATENIEFKKYNSAYPDQGASGEEVARHLKKYYQFSEQGFQEFRATDISLREGKLCDNSSFPCTIILYAKDGNKNVFIYISQ